MTRILALSDTHGDTGSIRDAMPLIRAIDPQIIYHLGDFTLDAAALRALTDIPVYAVRGNCDGSSTEPLVREETIDGVRILVTHGHACQVKSGTEMLLNAAKSSQCAAALYGHTHWAQIEREDGILLVNPGSLSRPRGRAEGTMALLMIEDGRIDATLLKP